MTQVTIDREKRLILLKWLRQGYIDTLDMPEAYKGGNLFLELLKESSVEDDEESQATQKTAREQQPPII